MSIGNLVAVTIIVLCCMGLGIIIFDMLTFEYKYTIQTECFDKFSNEIKGVSCQQDIMCGKIFKKVYIGNKIYSCDENIGFIEYRKQKIKK